MTANDEQVQSQGELFPLETPAIVVPQIPDHIFACAGLMDVMNGDTPDIRCFHLNDSRVFFGIVIAEAPDSFLVAAGARLIADENKAITAEPIVSEPIMRILKYGTSVVTRATPKFAYYYHQYLRDVGKVIIPSYMTEGRYKAILNMIQRFEFESNKDVAGIQSPFETVDIPGASIHAFRSIVASKRVH